MTNTSSAENSEITPGPKLSAIQQEGYLEILINDKVFLRNEAQDFHKLTSSFFKGVAGKILVNFNNCQYISSEGLGCIAEFWRKCNDDKAFKMVALFCQQPVNELLSFFEVIGLARVMQGHIFTDYNNAKSFLLED